MALHPLAPTLEQRCLHAWPALREQALDGWVLRFGDGFTRRANSVQSLQPGTLTTEARIAAAEAAYAAAGQPCVFKVTPLAQPAELDALLAARGYRREGETSVQLQEPLRGDATDTACTLGTPLAPDWQAAFTRMDATPSAQQSAFRAILGRIAPPHTAALLRAEGAAVSCGRAVCEDGLVGLFDIATDDALRGRGYAGRLIGHLLHWGRAQGADRAYLQVEADNTPALRLYAGLGFREIYRYWYRVR